VSQVELRWKDGKREMQAVPEPLPSTLYMHKFDRTPESLFRTPEPLRIPTFAEKWQAKKHGVPLDLGPPPEPMATEIAFQLKYYATRRMEPNADRGVETRTYWYEET
jgi:hypothetical protein